MFKKLIKLANYLDSKNFYDEANYLDQIIKKYSQMSYSEYSKDDDSKPGKKKPDRDNESEDFFFEEEYGEILDNVSDYKGDGHMGLSPGTAKELKEDIDKFIVKYIESPKFTDVVRNTLRQAKDLIDEENKEYYEANRPRSAVEMKMDKNIEKYKKRPYLAKIIPYGRPRENLGGRKVHYAAYDASKLMEGVHRGAKVIQVVNLANGKELRDLFSGAVKPYAGYSSTYDAVVRLSGL